MNPLRKLRGFIGKFSAACLLCRLTSLLYALLGFSQYLYCILAVGFQFVLTHSENLRRHCPRIEHSFLVLNARVPARRKFPPWVQTNSGENAPSCKALKILKNPWGDFSTFPTLYNFPPMSGFAADGFRAHRSVLFYLF